MTKFTEISVRGRRHLVRTFEIGDARLVVTGRWPKIAEIQDEEWLEEETLGPPAEIIEELKRGPSFGADIFSFSQTLRDHVPRFSYPYHWDSIAAIPVSSFADWWNKRISNHVRQDVNRAKKRGIEVRLVSFTNELVRGISSIYDETPVRQGRPFWHYGKSLDDVRQMNATYIERSHFLGAYIQEELVGFIKVVCVDRVARLMQILAKDAHRDKRPMNALIAKAVELCEQLSMSHLVYGNYHYFQGPDSLTAFKHRNGFEEVLVPRYYVPLSMGGRLAAGLGVERGFRALVPPRVLNSLRRIRAEIYRRLPSAA